MPAIFDWRQVSAPDDVARQLAKALADGAIVALPTEAGTVLAADPHQLADSNRPAGLPDGLRVSRLDGYMDAAAFFVQTSATPAERALAGRLWPGPVGWIHDESPYPAWIPSHTAVAAVLAAHRASLALFELNDGRPVDPGTLGDGMATAVIDGVARPGPVTLIRPNDTRWSIERPGILSEAAIRYALARKVVFVCTGNTCRSPMAEGLFKRRLAGRLGCTVEELPQRGFVVSSAGIAASAGDPATRESAEVLRAFGVDLSAHQSRPASADLIGRADDVVAMTRGHLSSLVGRYPVLTGALRLLGGADGDLDDPIGRGPDVYQTCATTIDNYVDRLITEMGLP